MKSVVLQRTDILQQINLKIILLKCLNTYVYSYFCQYVFLTDTRIVTFPLKF